MPVLGHGDAAHTHHGPGAAVHRALGGVQLCLAGIRGGCADQGVGGPVVAQREVPGGHALSLARSHPSVCQPDGTIVGGREARGEVRGVVRPGTAAGKDEGEEHDERPEAAWCRGCAESA